MSGFKLIFLILLLSIPYFVDGQTKSELEQVIEMHANQGDTLELSRAWYRLAKYYDQNKDLEASNLALLQALKLAKLLQNNTAIATISNYMAANFSDIGTSDSAIYYYQYAIKACDADGELLKKAKVLVNLSNEYSNIGKHKFAAEKAIEALSLKEQLGDSSNIVYYLQKVGEAYKAAGETDLWEAYVQRGYRLVKYEKYTDRNAKEAIYNDLGGIAEKKKEFQKALLYYDTLIGIATINNNQNALGVAYNNSATIYKLLGNNRKALQMAIKGAEFTSNISYREISNVSLLAELYFANHEIEKAKQYANINLENQQLEHFPDQKVRLYRLLYEIEKSEGNYKNALFYNEQFHLVSDSLKDTDVRKAILDMEMVYQTEKKEQQITLLTIENKAKNQRIKFGVVLLILLLIVLLLVVNFARLRKKQSELMNADLEQQLLRSQMNPHFIFNVLGSIQNFMLKNDLQQAASYLSKFAVLIRSTLEYSSEDLISLSDELKNLSHYIELEQMRSPDQFDFQILRNESLEADFIQIPPMLVQPFVENSIKHGFKKINRKGMLTIMVNDLGNFVEIVIEDNGSGLIENESDHHSMAMQIFEKRRKNIQRKHKVEFNYKLINLVDVDSKKTGVKVILKIPILE